MGFKFTDKYSLLHLASGVVVYYWNVSFIAWFIIHLIFELVENTQTGMHYIRMGFWSGLPPGQDHWFPLSGPRVACTSIMEVLYGKGKEHLSPLRPLRANHQNGDGWDVGNPTGTDLVPVHPLPACDADQPRRAAPITGGSQEETGALGLSGV